jgi:hypothetical protein
MHIGPKFHNFSFLGHIAIWPHYTYQPTKLQDIRRGIKQLLSFSPAGPKAVWESQAKEKSPRGLFSGLLVG